MHYTVDYNHITDSTKKRKAALRDCRQFLGRHHFTKIRKNLENKHAEGWTRDAMLLLLSIVGIQGYAAEVFVEYAQDRAMPKQLELDLQPTSTFKLQPITFKARIMPPIKI